MILQAVISSIDYCLACSLSVCVVNNGTFQVQAPMTDRKQLTVEKNEQ